MSFPSRGSRAGVHRRKVHASPAPRWRLMTRRILSRRQLLCGVALVALGSPAMADNIDTTTAWTGTSSIDPWGANAGVTPTYGQTITPTANQTILSGFTFELARESGTAPQFQAYVYQFNSTTHLIVGPALFTSGVMTAPSGTTFSAVTISTGSIALTAGLQYVLFLSTAATTGQAAASYKFGQLTNATTYAGGQFVFNNTATFAGLSTVPWTTSQPNDLAFIALLTSGPGFLSPLLPAGAPLNPTHVAAGIDNAIAGGATLPAGFNGLFLLTPTQLVGALNQLTGENNTQAQQGSFQITNSFLSLLTDPFTANRGMGSAMGFAPERGSRLPPAIASAYGMVTKAPPPVISYAPRWDVWGAAFGGGNRTSGDPTVVGSHDTTSNVGGVAAGADYRLSPDALVGFSLAGGATSWSLSGSNGGGRSDVFLAGLYGAKQFGAAYVSGAFSYSNYWMSTFRTVTVAGVDQLRADFNAQNFGGRLEGGYHLPTQWMAVQWTPYAAVQAQSFRTPSYGEIATSGSNQFALTYNGRTATAVRGELGVRTDKTFAVADGSQINLFAKLAWAHDEISDPNLNVSFIGLPTASFAVNGATPAHDLALVTAGSEWRFTSNVTVLAKFDGEFANRSQTYSGTARLRYTW
jgi:outer membrane autotransporter protein